MGMLVETLRFWMSRVDYDENHLLVLLNIMGPDEYTPMSRNNAYTNKCIRLCLLLIGRRDSEDIFRH